MLTGKEIYDFCSQANLNAFGKPMWFDTKGGINEAVGFLPWEKNSEESKQFYIELAALINEAVVKGVWG